MKDFKVKNKLLLGFGIIISFTFIITLISVLGMMRLKDQTDILTKKTIVNIEYVWEMRRNLVSESKNTAMALLDNTQQNIDEYLKEAQEDVNNNIHILEQYKSNAEAEVDLSKIEVVENIMEQEKAIRTKLYQVMQSKEPDALERGYYIFEQELQPLLDEQGVKLREIKEEQIQLSNEQIGTVNKAYYVTLITVGVVMLFVLITSVAVANKLLKAILTPLHEIENATNALAQGDFSVNISYESKDEFGTTCKSIQASFVELKRIINSTAYMLREMADGNFAVDPRMNFPGEMEEIEDAGADLIQKMNIFFSEIKASSNQISAGAEQVASGSQALAQGATEQASSIEELSASITEVSENVATNAENAKKANMLATTSGEVAEATLQDMKEMLSAMNEISISAENIEKVIKVIDDITFQTNILSLNAAVEAARAGVAGKGFAVVADEVGNLAQKSLDSAKEITSLIEGAIASVNAGERIAKKTSQAFYGLTEKISDVISTVNEIAVASQEQSESIKQVTIGVDQISCVVQTNSATSEESAAASEELSGQANILDTLVGQFKLGTEDHTYIPTDMRANQPKQNMVQQDFGEFDKY